MTDPIRIVDRRALAPGVFPVGRSVRRVEEELERINKELGRAGFTEKLEVPPRQLIGGQVSNVRAYLYNESRRAKEGITDATSGPITRGELLGWIGNKGLQGNRNTFSLSVGTHIRSAARQGVWNFIEAAQDSVEPITHVGVVLPRGTESSIRPGGVLSRYVGRAFPVDRWLRISQEMNRKRGSLSLGFTMGLHHGDPSQLFPISAIKLAAVREALKKYRDKTLNLIKKERASGD